MKTGVQTGDTFLTTDNPTIRRVFSNDKVIICDQKPAGKKVASRELFIEADKNGFGNKIGSITNNGTALYEVLARFEIGSVEYNEIIKRIRCIQKGQQDEIDKMKGIQAKKLPKGWFDKKVWDIEEGDDEETIAYKDLNRKLVANKKPYFFIYNYEYIMKEFKEYKRDADYHSAIKFNLKLEQILVKESKTDDEQKFVDNYYKSMPVSISSSTMNRICWKVEEAFTTAKRRKNKKYDYSILKTDKPYDANTYKRVLNLYDKHNFEMQSFKRISYLDNMDKDDVQAMRDQFKERFKEEVLASCNNLEDAANIAIDICYFKYPSRTKQFAWDIAGVQIINNLLAKNNHIVNTPVLDSSGDIEYRGNRFTMITRKVGKNGKNIK